MGEVEEKRKLRLAEQVLRKREADLQLAQQIGHIGSWEVDFVSDLLLWSDETHRIFGLDPATFVPTNEAFFELIHPDDLARVQRAVAEAIRTGADYQVEHRIRRRDGTERVVVEQARILQNAQGQAARMMGTVQDITERKQTQVHIQHLNQLLVGIRNVNKLIVRERDPQRLLAEACEILVQTRGYLLVWVGRPEENSKKVLPVACAGQQVDYIKSITVTCDESPTGQGPIGTALRTASRMSARTSSTDPCFEPWRALALERGYASMASLPLLHGERLLGVINVYADHPTAFDTEVLACWTSWPETWPSLCKASRTKRSAVSLKNKSARKPGCWT